MLLRIKVNMSISLAVIFITRYLNISWIGEINFLCFNGF